MITIEKKQLFEKIREVTLKVEEINRTRVKGVTYKVTQRNKILEKINPLLEDFKLILVPSEKSLISYETKEFPTERALPRIVGVASLTQSWRIIDTETSEYYEFTISSSGHGEGNFHAGQIALSVNQKYAMIMLFGLEVGDDEDDKYIKTESNKQQQEDVNLQKLPVSTNSSKITKLQLEVLEKMITQCKLSTESVLHVVNKDSKIIVKSLSDISVEKYQELLKKLENRLKTNSEQK